MNILHHHIISIEITNTGFPTNTNPMKYIHILEFIKVNPDIRLLKCICFICLGLINEILSWETPLALQMLIGSTIITILEFITGCIVNIWLGWNVWDYSNLPLNLLGQICLPFSILWYFISAIGIVIDDYIRYIYFDEERPRYKLF